MVSETNNHPAWGRRPATSAVDAFVAAVRAAAKDGPKRLKSVVDDYEYDCSRWSAGPRKATALIGLRVRVECVFALPMDGVRKGRQVRIDTSCGCGCWFSGGGVDHEDPEDVMRLAFEDEKQLLSELVLEGLIGRHAFRTLVGLGRLSKCFRASDYVYYAVAGGLLVSFTAEMEAY